MKQHVTIIPKDHIYFDELIDQPLAKYGICTKFMGEPEKLTLEIFLEDDPINSIQVIECDNSIALFKTLAPIHHETIKKLIGALENEFYTHMIYVDGLEVANQAENDEAYSKMSFSKNDVCLMDEFFYQKVIMAHLNRQSFSVPEHSDVFEDALIIKIGMGLSLLTKDPELLTAKNKNKLLIKINAKYRDLALCFNGPGKSFNIVDWALA
jgi:hypothetical protein